MNDRANGSWEENRKLVLHELARLESKIDFVFREHEETSSRLSDEVRDAIRELTESIRSLERDVAKLNVKAGMWGLIGGAIPAIVALVLFYLETK